MQKVTATATATSSVTATATAMPQQPHPPVLGRDKTLPTIFCDALSATLQTNPVLITAIQSNYGML